MEREIGTGAAGCRTAERVKRIRPSQTIELTNRVAELERAEKPVIRFNVGEPDFPTPEYICRAAGEAMARGFTRYTPVMGIPELREAICEKLARENGVSYSPEEVTIGAGAKQCISAALLAILSPGDEVIIPYPCWVSYTELVKLADGVPVPVPCREDFSLDLNAIRGAVTERTRAILINTPNNPTGAVYDKASLEELAELAVSRSFYIIADEVYEKFVYGGKRHVSAASFSDEARRQTILINGMSKSYAMTGWRLGYLAAEKEIVRAVNTLQSQMLSCVQSLSQKAAVAALTGTQRPVETMTAEFERRRDYMYERLTRMPGISCRRSEGAFYLLPDVRAYYGKSYGGKRLADDLQIAEYLLSEAEIAVVPGSAFLAPGHLRLSYSNSMEAIRQGMDRMERALGQLEEQ